MIEHALGLKSASGSPSREVRPLQAPEKNKSGFPLKSLKSSANLPMNTPETIKEHYELSYSEPRSARNGRIIEFPAVHHQKRQRAKRHVRLFFPRCAGRHPGHRLHQLRHRPALRRSSHPSGSRRCPAHPVGVPEPTRSTPTPSPPPCSRTSSGAEHEPARTGCLSGRPRASLPPFPPAAASRPCLPPSPRPSRLSWHGISPPFSLASSASANSANTSPVTPNGDSLPSAAATARKVRELNRVYDRLLQHSMQWTRTIHAILEAGGHTLPSRATVHFRG